jgi:formylglycine-generating enzyme required for sulfatase activity
VKRHTPPSSDTGESVDSGPDTDESGRPDDTHTGEDTAETGESGDTGEPAPCPEAMVLVEASGLAPFCMDLYEAPGRAGALPFVMFHLLEAGSWCEARGKRLCYDDEWEAACAGAAASAYPYGDTRRPGVCNDEETWRTYDQDLLNLWPWSLDTDPLEGLDALLDAVRAAGAGPAAEHVLALYQGEGSGENAGCTNERGVLDTIGNVEEWTLRRDGGRTDFHGNLKGRYWADTRTCQDDLTSHGDVFRFYEIGFRCCAEPRGA